MPTSGSWGKQRLRESRLLRLWNRVECAWATTEGFVSHCFFLLKHHTHIHLDSIIFSTLALLIVFCEHSETVHILVVVSVYFHLQLRGFFSFHAVSHSSSLSNFDNGLCEWWDLICHCRFDIGILSILSWGGSLILFCFCFFFKGCEDNLGVGFLTVGCLGNIFFQHLPHGISWGQLSLTEPQPLWIEVPVCALNYKLQKMSTRRQHFRLPSIGSWGNQILRARWLPGLWNRVECAWARRKGLETHYFFPLKPHTS